MNATAAARTVNCTQCGAPLDLNGGHRVRSLSCGYCGAVLDTRKEYEVVQQFKDVARPPMPLALGMRGKIKDVAFTIIGVVQYQDKEGYRWLEYQVFSPTHGYHWLSCTGGHFVFTRRVRETPTINPKRKATFKVQDRTFKVYESYAAEVRFVEGELTYVASVGDKVAAVEAISPPFIFTRERSSGEEEYQLGEYLPATEVYEAFGVQNPPPPPHEIHGAQPYVADSLSPGLSRMGRWFAVPALLLGILIFFFGNGTERLREQIAPSQFLAGIETEPFTVNGANKLLSLSLQSPLDNAWAWFDITVMKGGEAVARLAKQISYYHGVDSDGSWSEGSQSATAYFKLAEPGTYSLRVKGTGGEGNLQGKPQDRPLTLALNEGVIVSRYFFVLALITGLAALWAPLRRMRFEAKRWEVVEEDDGDEDDDDPPGGRPLARGGRGS